MGRQRPRETDLTWDPCSAGLAHTADGTIFRVTRKLLDTRDRPWAVELGLAMVVMMVMVAMRSRGERRSGEYQDQEHSSKNLLHGVNLA